MPKRERKVVTTFRLPESDKIKMENILVERGETWQSVLEPMAYSILNKTPPNPTRTRAVKENSQAAIELLRKAIKKMETIGNLKGYTGKRS
jgi:hypothetical protein